MPGAGNDFVDTVNTCTRHPDRVPCACHDNIVGRDSCVHMAIPPGRLELVFSFEFVGSCQVAPLHRLVSRLRTVGHVIVST